MRLEPWHLLAFVGLVYACASPKRQAPPGVGTGDAPPEPEEPVEPVRDLYVFAHDRSLVPVALAAARRIEAASGIKVHVNEYGTAATALPIFGSDFLCASGTEGRAGPYGIAMARDCKHDPEQVLIHEMLHQLGCGHLVLPQRGILNEAKDDPLTKISEHDLNALCAVRHCSVFAPEV